MNKEEKTFQNMLSFLTNDKNIKDKITNIYNSKKKFSKIYNYPEEHLIINNREMDGYVDYFDGTPSNNKRIEDTFGIYFVNDSTTSNISLSYNNQIFYHEIMHAITFCLEEENIASNYYNQSGVINNTSFMSDSFGTLLNENLTDLLATSAILYTKNKNIDLNDVFYNNKLFFIDGYSAYRIFEDITKLTLIAFSNDPSCNYNKIKENVLNSKYKYNNEETGNFNDLLYYHIWDSKKLIDLYDSYMGKGEFNNIELLIDNTFNDFIETNNIDNNKVILYIMSLEDFLNKKVTKYKNIGRYNDNDIKNLKEKFNNIKNRITNNLLVGKSDEEKMGFTKRKYNNTCIEYIDKNLLDEYSSIYSLKMDPRSIELVPSNLIPPSLLATNKINEITRGDSNERSRLLK